ncbi:hypothetical protein [Methanosphaera sp.]
MKNKSLIIICITAIICVLIASLTIINITNNNQDQQTNTLSTNNMNTSNSTNSTNNNSNSEGTTGSTTESSESSDYSSTDKVTVAGVSFHSDGNPDTGETAILYVGGIHRDKKVEVSMDYSRDGKSFGGSEYNWYTVSEGGAITIYTSTPMSKYPDKCVIKIRENGEVTTATFYLETRKGGQHVSPS